MTQRMVLTDGPLHQGAHSLGMDAMWPCSWYGWGETPLEAQVWGHTNRTQSPWALVSQVAHQVWPVPQVAVKVRVSDVSPATHSPQPNHPPPSSPAAWRFCFSSFSCTLPTYAPRAGSRCLQAPLCGQLGLITEVRWKIAYIKMKFHGQFHCVWSHFCDGTSDLTTAYKNSGIL